MSETYVQKARAFKAEPELLEELPLHETQGVRILELVDELRPELFGIVAVLADEIVSGTIADQKIHEPYGLITSKFEPVEDISNFEELENSIGRTLRIRGINVQADHIRDGSPITTRLGYLCSIFYRMHDARYTDQYTLMAAGLTTASVQTVEALKAVSRTVQNHEPGADSARVAEVARNSGRIITKVASLPLSQLERTAIILKEAGQEPREGALTLYQGLYYKTDAQGKPYVDFVQPISHMPCPENPRNESIGVARPPVYRQLGCPATARLDGASSISKLWNWAIDIAEDQNILASPDAYYPTDSQAA